MFTSSKIDLSHDDIMKKGQNAQLDSLLVSFDEIREEEYNFKRVETPGVTEPISLIE